MLQVRSIVEWIPGELLIASDEGLTSYNIVTGKGETLRSDYRQTNGLNDNYLQTLFVDHEQALWVGTYFGGVNYIPPTGNSFIHYYRGNTQLDARIISVFAQADQDNLWLGTDDAGFFYWDRKKNTFKSYKPQHSVSGPTYHNIHALLQDGDKLYIGMYMGGLDIMDLKTGKFKNYKFGSSSRSLYASGIYALYKDSAQRLWVGTTNGLNKYIPETDDFERIYEVHPADVSYIMEDKKGIYGYVRLIKVFFVWMGKHKNGNIFLYERGKRRISPLFLPIRLLLLVWMKKKIYGLEQMDAAF